MAAERLLHHSILLLLLLLCFSGSGGLVVVPPPSSSSSSSPTTSLLEWAKEKGADLSKSNVATTDAATGLRGVVATRPVRAKEPFLSVPRDMLFVPSRREALRSGVIPPALYDEADEKERLAFSLIALCSSDAASAEMGPFLSCLPEQGDFDMPAVSWSDQQLDRLACPPIVANAKRRRRRREDIVRALTASGCNEGDVLWALDIVNSRALGGKFGSGGVARALVAANVLSVAAAGLAAAASLASQALLLHGSSSSSSSDAAMAMAMAGPPWWLAACPAAFAAALVLVGTKDEIALIPCVDMVNHASSAGRSLLRYDLFSDRLSLNFDAAVAPGEEVRFCYGGARGISNDRLIMLYGFVDEDNEGDVHEMAVPGCSKGAGAVVGRRGKILRFPKALLREGREAGGATPVGRNEPVAALTVGGEVVSAAALAALVDAAREELARIDGSGESNGGPAAATTTMTKEELAIDAARRDLAERWKAEKVRLLREFEAAHSQPRRRGRNEEKSSSSSKARSSELLEV